MGGDLNAFNKDLTFSEPALNGRAYFVGVEYVSAGLSKEWKKDWSCCPNCLQKGYVYSAQQNTAKECRTQCEDTVEVKYCAYNAGTKSCTGFMRCDSSTGAKKLASGHNEVWTIVVDAASRNTAGRRMLTG